ncbi:hypothetical protein [Vibrio sp.]|uniref:hypothetical protein n=1 Tax=Vibrio sp. TaxID=678 RepID=UPI003D133F1C
MSYELVIKSSKAIETQLSNLGARGKGLHEKVTSIETQLDSTLVTEIRRLATMRNKLIHEEDYEFSVSDEIEFEHLAELITDQLERSQTTQPILDQIHVGKRLGTLCRSCDRDVTPRMVFDAGVPTRSYCPHCGSLIKDFNYTWFGETFYNLYLAWPMLSRVLWKGIKVVGISFLALIALIIALNLTK